jgi:hypothetical protein
MRANTSECAIGQLSNRAAFVLVTLALFVVMLPVSRSVAQTAGITRMRDHPIHLDIVGKVVSAEGGCREVLYYSGPSAARVWACWRDPKDAPPIGDQASVKGMTSGVHRLTLWHIYRWVPVVADLPNQ